MIIMSVDLGKARTGIAASDESESFAFPKTVITEYNSDKLVTKICETAKQLNAGLIVVGNPKNMDGTSGEKSAECSETAQKIADLSGIETVLYDERCTTVIAHRTMSDNGKKTKKHKKTVDAIAATVILEDYLKFRKTL